jgi:hypothetical protein
MTPLTRPMKATTLLPSGIEHTDDNIIVAMRKLKFPVLVSLKVDGIRSVRTTDLFSCRMKLIPNVEIRRRSMILPYGFDMELYTQHLEYHEIESIVMSEEHERHLEINFWMIDWYLTDDFDYPFPYGDRMRRLSMWNSKHPVPGLIFKKPDLVDTPDQLMEVFLRYEKENGEGICFRTLNSPYKQGYSTLNEQYLVKLCRYVREEVTIIGFNEQMVNKNRSNRNALGLMDRSSMKSRQQGKGTLGAFIVMNKDGLTFNVGTGEGLTESKRQEIWDNQDKWINKQITIKHKPHGQKLKPRSPVYVGLREDGY